MEDLLQEEDFKKAEYHPWKQFRVFYLLAVLVIVFWQTLLSLWFKSAGNLIVFVIYMLIPTVVCAWMFTVDYRSFLLNRSIKMPAITGLALCFWIPNLIINAVKIIYSNPNNIETNLMLQFWSSLMLFAVELALCFGVMFILNRVITKRIKQQ